jgi:hypothetical protein
MGHFRAHFFPVYPASQAHEVSFTHVPWSLPEQICPNSAPALRSVFAHSETEQFLAMFQPCLHSQRRLAGRGVLVLQSPLSRSQSSSYACPRPLQKESLS